MPKVFFRNHDAAQIASALEIMLRTELGASQPIPYEVEAGPPRNLGTALGEIGRVVTGGQSNAIRLFTLYFTIAHPRPGELRVMVGKQGIGAYAGGLLYTCPLNAQVVSATTFTEGKPPTLTGDPTAGARLNANPDITRRLDKFLRKRMAISAGSISIQRFCQIAPLDQGVVLAAYTLAKHTSFGFSSSLDAKEFFDLATIIEAALA